jgi:hypothetical protein
MKVKLLGVTALLCGLAIAINNARADVLAYAEIAGGIAFGVVDLNTGSFTPIGSGMTGQGLGAGPDGGIYTGNATSLYSINPTNGVATLVGSSASIVYWEIGSTTTGLYALGTDGNLFSINPNTGAATSIGPSGLSAAVDHQELTMSNGSDTLYMTSGGALYVLNTTTGAASLVGSGTPGTFGGLVVVNDVIYGAESSGLLQPAIYTIDASSGAQTFQTFISGGDPNYLYGLVSVVPELSTWAMMLIGFAGVGFVAYRRTRKIRTAGL